MLALLFLLELFLVFCGVFGSHISQVGNVLVDNSGISETIYEHGLVFVFWDSCSSGYSLNERSDLLLAIYPCMTLTGAGFVTFSSEVENSDRSYLFVDVTDDTCLDETTDLSDLCIKTIFNDFSVTLVENTISENDENCIQVPSYSSLTDGIPYTWGLDSLDEFGSKFWAYDGNTNSVDIFVVDTGIISSHVDFSSDAGTVSNLYTPTPGEYFNSDSDHGTHVASIIAGSRYGVVNSIETIWNVYVLNGQGGSGSFATVGAGLNAVKEYLKTSNKRGVINMSFEASYTDDLNTFFTNFFVEMVNNGGIPIAAAGNSGTDGCNTLPAASPLAISVGAHNANYQSASFSNYGTCVDIYGPGVAIIAAVGTYNQATNSYDKYNYKSGTSMSAPMVSGIVVNYLLECEKTGYTEPCSFANTISRLQDYTVSVTKNVASTNEDQCGDTGVECEAVQYFCGRRFYPREIEACSNSPCSLSEAGECQVYNSDGCSQCKSGSFKIDNDYPCVNCQTTFGTNCMFCNNGIGCAQCTSNTFYLQIDQDTGLQYCEPQPCLNSNNNCRVCNNGYCSQCNDGYTLNQDAKSCS